LIAAMGRSLYLSPRVWGRL